MSEISADLNAAEGAVEGARLAMRALGLLPPKAPLDPEGMNLKLIPREEGLQAKDVPVDQLFKKIISMRDKLRVLEQRVNSSELSLAEKAALEARITLLYEAIAGLVAFFSEDALPHVDAEGADA